VKEYGGLTAREYRHGRGSPLGARYEQLMSEAARAGAASLPELTEFESTGRSMRPGHSSHDALVTQMMTGAETREARGRCALGILCGDGQAEGGHLYLFGESGLHLAASLGNGEPPDELLGFAAKLFEQPEEFLTMTVALEAEAMPPETASTRFVDEAGTVFECVRLTSAMPDLRHAGVAVLRYSELPRRSPSPLLASAVSAHLLRAGDTAGVAAAG